MSPEQREEKKMIRQAMVLMLGLSSVIYAAALVYCMATGKMQTLSLLLITLVFIVFIVMNKSKETTHG